jgi:hypothetical protein
MGANKVSAKCPLCGRPAEVERLEGREACRVACDQCVAYTIANAVLHEIARAREARVELSDRLSGLSDEAAWAELEGGHFSIDLDTWRASPVDERLPAA